MPPPVGPAPGAEGPRRLHPASPLVEVAGLGLGLVIFSLGDPGRMVVGFVIVGLAAAARAVRWATFTYELDGRSLITQGGVLNRTRRVVPLDRVQQVDLQRKLRHQLFGLAVVRVDTAGTGNEAEVTLDAVSLAEAERLRALLTHRPTAGGAAPTPGPGALAPPAASGWGPAAPAGHPSEVAPPPPVGLWEGTAGAGWVPGADPAPAAFSGAPEEERHVLALSAGRLALGGITGSKLAVVFVVAGALVGLVDDLPRGLRQQAVDSASDGARAGVSGLGLVLLVALPVVVALAAGAAVLTDGGYRLTRRGDLLQVRRGLLDQRHASLAVHRVQVVRIHQNPVRRALGLVSVTLQSAGGSGQVENQDARVNVPILRRSELDALLAEVLPHAPHLPALEAAPAAARRRAWVRRVLPVLVVAGVVAVLFAPVGLLALALVPLAALDAELAYRGLGWATVDDHVVARRGGLTRETALVPVAKVQSTRLTSSPFQRRAGLATLHIDVAGQGRPPQVADAAAAAMDGLHRATTDATAARRDEDAVRRRTVGALVAATPPG